MNDQIAIFRDLLIHVGTNKDAPELREKIRRVRRQCVEGCQQTNNQLLPQVKRYVSDSKIPSMVFDDMFPKCSVGYFYIQGKA